MIEIYIYYYKAFVSVIKVAGTVGLLIFIGYIIL